MYTKPNTKSLYISNVDPKRVALIQDKLKDILADDERFQVLENNDLSIQCISTNKNEDNNSTGYLMENLVNILKGLRGENGCPWDKEQTHESLKPCLIEEAYEVIDAIDHKNMDSLEEELGDLLLQVVFHANIAEEKSTFDIQQVIKKVSHKMIYRHPHVFGNVNAENTEKALLTWEEMKKNEKQLKSYTEQMQDIPSQLPALMKSYKVQKKAAQVGFDWDYVEDAFDKVQEELNELLDIYEGQDKEKTQEELGDLLFAVVNVARFLGIEPEQALNTTFNKFINRFSYIEQESKRMGKRLEEMNLTEMDHLWEEAKKNFRKSDKKEGFFQKK
ncbi:MAG: nucleoside triphosphate pyrophosphohydrolase [Clostridia bacterium]|nr:nucleoside triphosphate pyrophosphohydrolase [Clostridia bacterium]